MSSARVAGATGAAPAYPLDAGGLAALAQTLRQGERTIEALTATMLERIAALDPVLGAYEHVARDRALARARALDAALGAGIDLGPLMGVPVAVKDLLAVDGMPVTAGSVLDVTDLVGPPGPFVRTLERAGCVILGKTRTVEFALGGAGTNRARGTPRNPWDEQVHRAPGGSSSGSAVAAVAGLCAVAIGSDTGGSVRSPAAFCGAFGLKTTKGLWPTDGVFPLAPTLDTLGLLTRSAADAAWFFHGVQGGAPLQPAPLRGLRLGRPTNHFFEVLEPAVERAVEAALVSLQQAGVVLVDVEIPEASADDPCFYDLIVAEFLAGFGRDRFLAGRERMDPDVARWAETGLDIKADRYVRCLQEHERACALAAERLRGLDGLVAPTRPIVAPPIEVFDDAQACAGLARLMARNTRYANMAGLCATSTPIPAGEGGLPVGLMVMCPAHADARALSIALAIESVLDLPPTPAWLG